MKRKPSHELLDSDQGSSAEINASLSDLRRINRLFGGVSVTAFLVRRVAELTGQRSFTLLEVAAGRGDVVEMSIQKLQKRGIELLPTLLDRSIVHLSHAFNARSVAADAMALPFRNSSFDLVSCCLFAHHLNESEFVKFMNEALRVCRNAVLINDIVRNPLHLVLTYVGYPLYRSRITRNDGPASVRQAYTADEVRSLLTQTCAARVELSRHYLFRMGAILWKERDV